MTMPGNKSNDPFVTSYEKRESVPVFSIVIVPANGLMSNPPPLLCRNAPAGIHGAVALLTCYDLRFQEAALVLRN